MWWEDWAGSRNGALDEQSMTKRFIDISLRLETDIQSHPPFMLLEIE